MTDRRLNTIYRWSGFQRYGTMSIYSQKSQLIYYFNLQCSTIELRSDELIVEVFMSPTTFYVDRITYLKLG